MYDYIYFLRRCFLVLELVKQLFLRLTATEWIKTYLNSNTLLKNKTMTNKIKSFLSIFSNLRDLPVRWRRHQVSSDLVISWGEILVDMQPGIGPESIGGFLVFCTKISELFTWLVYPNPEKLFFIYPLLRNINIFYWPNKRNFRL